MYRGHTVGVIVPAYNEESHVGTVLATIPSFVDRIYAIDDRSTDDTWKIIQEYATVSERMTTDGSSSGLLRTMIAFAVSGILFLIAMGIDAVKSAENGVHR